MGVFALGGQRVGLVFSQPTLDDDGHPVLSEWMEAEQGDSVVLWVDNSLFEIQQPTEVPAETVTTSEIAYVAMPVADGKVPTVDDDGNAVVTLVTAITANVSVRYDSGADFVMRGPAVLEHDLRGREDHVALICERETP